MTSPWLGVWVRRFLLEHLVHERNLARNTQRSYRDTLLLLLPFATEKLGKPVDRLMVVDLSADLVRAFSRIWSSPDGVRRLPVTSDWRPSTRWLALWGNTVRSTLHGAVRSA